MIAKKYFGQNFITDKNLINKIVSIIDNEKNHLIIEIGPGRGALTKYLLEKFDTVTAIEIDNDLAKFLDFKENKNNFNLLIEDFLTFDLEKYLLENKNKFKKISLISNTPYYISSEIIFKTLKFSKYFDKAVFMLQKEVATRICANVNENNYNNLSIACELYAKRKYEFTVGKQMFNPVPKVDSAIISFKFNNNNLDKLNGDDEKFLSFVRLLFNNKRKNILNNLTSYTKDKELSKIYLDKLNIDSNLRPENLSLDLFISIFKLIKDK